MSKNKKSIYVNVDELCEDLGISRSKGYSIIKQMNEQLKKKNPNYILISGKISRKYYEECIYGG